MNSLEIKNEELFRSTNLVNEDYDMIRVTLTCNKNEWDSVKLILTKPWLYEHTDLSKGNYLIKTDDNTLYNLYYEIKKEIKKRESTYSIQEIDIRNKFLYNINDELYYFKRGKIQLSRISQLVCITERCYRNVHNDNEIRELFDTVIPYSMDIVDINRVHEIVFENGDVISTNKSYSKNINDLISPECINSIK